MTLAEGTAPTSKGMLWTGRILSGLVAAFMLFNGGIAVTRPAFAREGFAHLGYPDSAALGVAIALVASAVIYAIPRTSILGAVLLTGYLGGATASHVRIGEPFYFPLAVAVLAWVGIYLREARLRALIPLRSKGF
ncbi:MAG TPA: DoxX family protein [Candidatus Sulfotelmatobacter sp.]|nr:DoxX family protein [Candidatus Sulfotelmatobacter sp.]